MGVKMGKKKMSSVWFGLSWFAFITGLITICIGIYNMGMAKSVQGYYLQSTVLITLASMNLQKTLYDKSNGVKSVTGQWLGVSWGALILAIITIGIGIYNLDAPLSVQGFYSQSILLVVVTSFNLQKVLLDKLDEDTELGNDSTIKTKNSSIFRNTQKDDYEA